MKLALYNLLLFLLFSCVTKNNDLKYQNTNLNCNENKTFKKEFYKNINVVDSLIYKNQNDQFNKSLLFISKYTNVSFESRLNPRFFSCSIFLANSDFESSASA